MKSITHKALASVLGSALIILSITSTVSYFQLKHQQWAIYEKQKYGFVNQLNIILKDPIFSYDLPVLRNIVAAYEPNQLLSRITILDQRDRLMVSAQAQRTPHESLVIPVTYNDDKPIGSIQLDLSSDFVHATLTSKLWEIAINTLLTLMALSIVTLFLLQRILVTPIRRVSKTIANMHKNGEFDLTQRVRIDSNDETGQLSKTFNEMLEAVSLTMAEVSQNTNHVSDWLRTFDKISQKTTETTLEQKHTTALTLHNIHELHEAAQGIVRTTDTAAIDCSETMETVHLREQDVAESLRLVRQLVNELNTNATN